MVLSDVALLVDLLGCFRCFVCLVVFVISFVYACGLLYCVFFTLF